MTKKVFNFRLELSKIDNIKSLAKKRKQTIETVMNDLIDNSFNNNTVEVVNNVEIDKQQFKELFKKHINNYFSNNADKVDNYKSNYNFIVLNAVSAVIDELNNNNNKGGSNE